MKRLVMLFMLMAFAAFAAAAVQEKQADARPDAAMRMMMMDKMMVMMDNPCPMKLGPDVAVTDTPTGIALTFTSKPGNVAEFRRRVERWATMHSSENPTAAMMRGRMMPGAVSMRPSKTGQPDPDAKR